MGGAHPPPMDPEHIMPQGEPELDAAFETSLRGQVWIGLLP